MYGTLSIYLSFPHLRKELRFPLGRIKAYKAAKQTNKQINKQSNKKEQQRPSPTRRREQTRQTGSS